MRQRPAAEAHLSALGVGVVGDVGVVEAARPNALRDLLQTLLALCEFAGPRREASLQMRRAGRLVPVPLLRLDDARGALSVVRTREAPVSGREAVGRAAAGLADGGVRRRLLSDGALPDLDGDDEVLERRLAEGDDDAVAAGRLEAGDPREVPRAVDEVQIQSAGEESVGRRHRGDDGVLFDADRGTAAEGVPDGDGDRRNGDSARVVLHGVAVPLDDDRLVGVFDVESDRGRPGVGRQRGTVPACLVPAPHRTGSGVGSEREHRVQSILREEVDSFVRRRRRALDPDGGQVVGEDQASGRLGSVVREDRPGQRRPGAAGAPRRAVRDPDVADEVQSTCPE